MRRFVRPSAAAAVLALVTMACASLPKAPVARPVPDAEGLARWLERDSGPKDGQPDYFIQMADTQLGMSEYSLLLLYFDATSRDDQFGIDARLFESAIRHANELKPAFVVICGDLVNRVGHAGQIAEFQRIAAMLDPSIPLHVVAGNHDVGNVPTQDSLRAYRKAFGPDRYSFREGGIYGIVLNSQLIDAPENVPEEAERQLSWVREELDRARASDARHILVFQHQSLFLSRPDEDDQYFNIEREARAVYLDLFEKAGVEAILAGHYHRNAHGRAGDLEMITNGPVGKPLGDDPSGFRIVEVGEDSLRHEYFSLEGH